MAAVPAEGAAPPTLVSVSKASNMLRVGSGWGGSDSLLLGAQGLENTTVTEGQSVALECHIGAQPAPVIMWFREDYRIESSSDFHISYEDGLAQLLIREAFAEDSGRFTCTATNEAGTVSTSCYLLVRGASHPRLGLLLHWWLG